MPPEPGHWCRGLAGCRRLDPTHPALVTCGGAHIEPCRNAKRACYDQGREWHRSWENHRDQRRSRHGGWPSRRTDCHGFTPIRPECRRVRIQKITQKAAGSAAGMAARRHFDRRRHDGRTLDVGGRPDSRVDRARSPSAVDAGAPGVSWNVGLDSLPFEDIQHQVKQWFRLVCHPKRPRGNAPSWVEVTNIKDHRNRTVR